MFFVAPAATATATAIAATAATATATTAIIEHVTDYRPEDGAAAAKIIYRSWRRWLARRAGPLLWFRDESNNPSDFYSCEPVKTIPIRDVISFVAGDKGYIMDIKSATSLIDHAKTSGEGEVPLNPFNRSPLPAIFLKRVQLHKRSALRPSIPAPTEGMSDLQKLALAVTDVFRGLEDLGYYTDPSWFLDLNRMELQRLYIEIADIWKHRASLTSQDRARIVPQANPLPFAVTSVLVMNQKALRHNVLNTCKLLTSAAVARSDRQLGIMYMLGALSIISPGAAVAYPWLVEMFSPGVTRIVGSELIILHTSVLAY